MFVSTIIFSYFPKIIRTTFWSRYHKGLRSDDADQYCRTVDGPLPAIDTVTTIISNGDTVGDDAEMKMLVGANEVDTLPRKFAIIFKKLCTFL